jgi:hypothetical protein
LQKNVSGDRFSNKSSLGLRLVRAPLVLLRVAAVSLFDRPSEYSDIWSAECDAAAAAASIGSRSITPSAIPTSGDRKSNLQQRRFENLLIAFADPTPQKSLRLVK